MNFKRKMVSTVIGCTLILITIFFTVISIVDFNSQNASAQFRQEPYNKVGIKIKINYDVKTVSEPKKHEDDTKKDIKDKLKKAIEDNTNLEVFGGEHRLEWMIYCLINQEHYDTINRKAFIPEGAVTPDVFKTLSTKNMAPLVCP